MKPDRPSIQVALSSGKRKFVADLFCWESGRQTDRRRGVFMKIPRNVHQGCILKHLRNRTPSLTMFYMSQCFSENGSGAFFKGKLVFRMPVSFHHWKKVREPLQRFLHANSTKGFPNSFRSPPPPENLGMSGLSKPRTIASE